MDADFSLTAPAQPASQAPSIRLIAATPSASGISGSEPNNTIPSIMLGPDSSWGSIPTDIPPSALAPSNKPSRGRLVPKRSKLNVRAAPEQVRTPSDFSDVVRRIGSNSARGGFEIHVDRPEEAQGEGEVMLVKKKKGRPVLNGLKWGSSNGALEEVTNIPSTNTKKEQSSTLKVAEGKDTISKWWSIGRGRKESKEKENKETKKEKRTKCTGLLLLIVH